MNEVFWLSWKAKQKELKKVEPKCTCNSGRKHPHKTYHYVDCPFLKFWNQHFREHWDSVRQQKLVQTVMEEFLK